MRLRSLGFALLLSVVGLCGCRDEQAGPHRQASRAGARSNPGAGGVFDGLPRQLTFKSGATLGEGTIQYLGSAVDPPKPKPGETVSVAHYFRALKAPPPGFAFFVHVVDASNGQMLGNLDHEFQAGGLPLDRWPVGKVVEDRHSMVMPQGAANVRLLMGFWQGDSRLGVDQPQGHEGSNRLLGPVVGGGVEAPLPEYHVKKTQTPPKIDGDLSDAAWKDATPVTLTRSFDGGPVQFKTTARLTYDASNLYVAFDCEDPDVWGTKMQRDDDIYNEEVVEIFLDANADQKTYNELEVSPNNVIFDAYFESYRSDLEKAKAWDAQMKTAVKVHGTVNQDSDQDQGWSVEMAIPLARLAEVPHVPPQSGDRWRFNLYRLEHPHRRGEEGQSFSPLFKGDFHNLARFGWLVFESP